MSAKGRELLLRARQQFRDLRTVATLVPLEVPEWGARIYYWPAMSVAESAAVGQYMEMRKAKPNGNGTDQIEFHLTYGNTLHACMANVLHRARDENGTLLFEDADEAALHTDVDDGVVMRLGQQMGFSSPTVEDAEKN